MRLTARERETRRQYEPVFCHAHPSIRLQAVFRQISLGVASLSMAPALDRLESDKN